MLTHKYAWVAVMTRGGAEELVAQRLREDIRPIECYLPMITMKDKRRRANADVEHPMFPNYLFARINDELIYQTRTTRGVVYIVSSNHSIIEVPERDIEAVRRFEASQRKIHIHETTQLVRGRKVTVRDGEFAGMEGTLVKDCKDGNFCVSIDVMHVSMVVRLRRDELRPAENEEGVTAGDALNS